MVRIAHHVQYPLPFYFLGGVKQIDKDIRRVLYDAYKKTDENFLRESIQQ